MADVPDVHIESNTKEEVAYKLTSAVMRHNTGVYRDKDAILNLFAESLLCVVDPSGYLARNYKDLVRKK